MISICFTYFRSLALSNLEAALYSVRRQNLERVNEVVIIDNNTDDSLLSIQHVVDELQFPVPVRIGSCKHGDSTKTHSWSTNHAVKASSSPWILFCRADYILDFNLVERFVKIVDAHPDGWNGFVTGNVYHLGPDISVCNGASWRTDGPAVLQEFLGTTEEYTSIDAGVWMARKQAFEQAGGLDESLSAWGHAQTHFQYKMFLKGVEFVRIPEVMFYHPKHSAPRDLNLAHQQVKETGIDIKQMWARYEGAQPY